jgi:hypothetical protein
MPIDDLFDEFDKFELEGATKLSPREYARLKGMTPQLVYYYIRNGVIETESCICGRRVVDVASANEALQTKKETRRK